MGKCFIKVRIHCLLYLNSTFFHEFCDFPQIVRSDAIWGQLCEIAPSRNIRWPVSGGCKTTEAQLKEFGANKFDDLVLSLTLKFQNRVLTDVLISLQCVHYNWDWVDYLLLMCYKILDNSGVPNENIVQN